MMSEIDDQAAGYWERRGEAELEIHLNPFTGEPQGLRHEMAARVDDAMYGAFTGGGKDEALLVHTVATRLAEVTAQRDELRQRINELLSPHERCDFCAEAFPQSVLTVLPDRNNMAICAVCQRDLLLAALEAVEWTADFFGNEICWWCDAESFSDHADDCQREAAIALATKET